VRLRTYTGSVQFPLHHSGGISVYLLFIVLFIIICRASFVYILSLYSFFPSQKLVLPAASHYKLPSSFKWHEFDLL